MQKIAILTDSGSDVPAAVAKQLNITVLPLQVNFKGGSYRDGVEISAQEVYHRLPVEIPTTSLPKGEDLQAIFDQFEKEGVTHILAVTLSSGLSGTNNMIRLASEEAYCPMVVLDTKNIGIGSGMSVIAAARWVAEGKSFDEVIDLTKKAIENTKIYFVLSTLEYLQKGGRIGKVTALLGSTFDLKPIITCNDEGIYTTVTKARGRKQSLRKTVDLAKAWGNQAKIHVAVAHGSALDEANEIIEGFKASELDVQEVYLGPVSPALGVHTGPGLIGVCVQRIVE